MMNTLKFFIAITCATLTINVNAKSDGSGLIDLTNDGTYAGSCWALALSAAVTLDLPPKDRKYLQDSAKRFKNSLDIMNQGNEQLRTQASMGQNARSKTAGMLEKNVPQQKIMQGLQTCQL